jgi:uncharacterized membrane protein YphA (DoxX/SURF4 family)
MKTKLFNVMLLALRLVIGWHFLYEGVSKIFTPGWTSKYYLEGSLWIGKGFFAWIANTPALLSIADVMNVWGLTLIGLALILGVFTRWAAIGGAAMLLMYIVAYPPIAGYTFGGIVEGSYLWINKNTIELVMLILLAAVDRKELWGIDRLYATWRSEKAYKAIPIPTEADKGRRDMLRDLIGVPVLGAFAYACYKQKRWDSFERKFLVEKENPDATSGATLRSFQFSRLDELKGQVPKGQIKGIELSRMIMGGNLIGGWAHARDLIYADKLVKAYHSDEKVMQTLLLGEKCGMNALVTNPQLNRVVNKYRHELNSKLLFISDCGIWDNLFEGIDRSIQGGADMLYCQGGITDYWIQNGRIEDIAKAVDMIKKNGLPAGVGAHSLESVKACVEFGIKPDFWVKTLHHHNYWSSGKKWQNNGDEDVVYEERDNVFCYNPNETIRFMNTLEEPWIAFKVLAAGAIQPEDGFKYAFDNGADFICVGMYDFQVVDDTNILLDTLANLQRPYPWRG